MWAKFILGIIKRRHQHLTHIVPLAVLLLDTACSTSSFFSCHSTQLRISSAKCGEAIKMQISSGHVMMLQFNLAHINSQRTQTGREQPSQERPTDTNSTAGTASSATFAFTKRGKKGKRNAVLTLFWPFVFRFPISPHPFAHLTFWVSCRICFPLAVVFFIRFSVNFQL